MQQTHVNTDNNNDDDSEYVSLAAQNAADLVSLQQHIRQLESQLAASALTSAHEHAEARVLLDERSEQLAATRNKFELAAKNLKILLPKYKNLSAKHTECKAELDECRSSAAASTADHVATTAEAESQLNAQIERLKAQCEAARQETLDLQREHAEATNQHAAHRHELEQALRAAHEEAQHEASRAETCEAALARARDSAAEASEQSERGRAELVATLTQEVQAARRDAKETVSSTQAELGAELRIAIASAGRLEEEMLGANEVAANELEDARSAADEAVRASLAAERQRTAAAQTDSENALLELTQRHAQEVSALSDELHAAQEEAERASADRLRAEEEARATVAAATAVLQQELNVETAAVTRAREQVGDAHQSAAAAAQALQKEQAAQHVRSLAAAESSFEQRVADLEAERERVVEREAVLADEARRAQTARGEADSEIEVRCRQLQQEVAALRASETATAAAAAADAEERAAVDAEKQESVAVAAAKAKAREEALENEIVAQHDQAAASLAESNEVWEARLRDEAAAVEARANALAQAEAASARASVAAGQAEAEAAKATSNAAADVVVKKQLQSALDEQSLELERVRATLADEATIARTAAAAQAAAESAHASLKVEYDTQYKNFKEAAQQSRASEASELSELKNHATAAAEGLAATTARCGELEAASAQLQEDRDAAAQECEAETRRAAELQSELETLVEQLQQQQSSRLRAEEEEKRRSMEDEAAATETASELEAEVAAAQAYKSKHKKLKATLKTTIVNATAEVDALRQELEEGVRAKAENTQQRVVALESECAALRNELSGAAATAATATATAVEGLERAHREGREEFEARVLELARTSEEAEHRRAQAEIARATTEASEQLTRMAQEEAAAVDAAADASELATAAVANYEAAVARTEELQAAHASTVAAEADEFAAYNAELQAATASVSTVQAKNERLAEEHNEVVEHLSVEVAALQHARASANAGQGNASKVEAERDLLERRRAELASHLEALSAEHTDSVAALEAQRTRSQQLLERAEAAEEQVLEQRLQQHDAETADNNTLLEHEQRLEAAHQRLEELEASHELTTNTARERYEVVVTKLKTTYEMSVALKTKNERLASERSDLTEKLQSEAEALRRAQAKLKDERARVPGVDANINVAKVLEDHAALTQENDKLSDELERLVVEHDDAIAKLTAEEHRSQLLLARVETAEEGVAKQQDSDVAKLEQEKRDLMAELAHMATTLKRERAKAIEIDKLQRSFLSMQQQQDDRLSEIKRTDLAIIQEVRDSSAHDTLTLRDKLAAEETKVRLLAKKLKQVGKAQKERDAHIADLEAQLNDSTRLVAIGKTQIAKLSSLLAQTSLT